MFKTYLFSLFFLACSLSSVAQKIIGIKQNCRFVCIEMLNQTNEKIDIFYNGINHPRFKFQQIRNDTALVNLSKPSVHFSEPVVWRFEGRSRIFLAPGNSIFFKIPNREMTRVKWVKMYFGSTVFILMRDGLKWLVLNN